MFNFNEEKVDTIGIYHKTGQWKKIIKVNDFKLAPETRKYVRTRWDEVKYLLEEYDRQQFVFNNGWQDYSLASERKVLSFSYITDKTEKAIQLTWSFTITKGSQDIHQHDTEWKSPETPSQKVLIEY